MALPIAQHRSRGIDKRRKLARTLWLGGVLALWLAALVARLYHLQVIQYTGLLARAQRQQQRTVEIAPQRGTIFDRQMHPLAMSLAVDSVCAVPFEIPDHEMVSKLLAPVLGLEAGDLLGRFKASRSFCWVKRKVSFEEAARVRALNLKGIYLQKEMKRFYPKGELAAHVLGTVGMDDHGLAGLEYGLDPNLRGRPGRVLVAADARRQSFRSTEWKGQPGKSVVLTLDETIQYITEKELEVAVRKWHAAGGTAIVQNPQTGEILALASEPTFNPNEYGKSDPAARVNRGIGWVYEPGSTFKLVTVSAALEEKLTNPQEVIDCQQGSIVLAGHVIHDHKPYGGLTVEQVLAQSSSVGAIKLGLRLGEERLHRYICRFGFNAPTEIELPGEERGLLKPPHRWSGISIGGISMGQEVGVTALQLATAYSAIANGGILFQARVVRDIFRDSEHDPLSPARGHRVITEQTAASMRAMLAAVVERGTGVSGRLNGYSSAGKTGTAQKIGASGTYSKTDYVASFVGFAPVSRPAVTVLVVIDSPIGAIYGAEVAAPVFRSITEQILSYLNVPQDSPARWLQLASSAPTGFSQQKRGGPAGFPLSRPGFPGAATPPLRLASFSENNILAKRRAAGLPPPGTIVLSEGASLAVPDFSGLSVRQVAEGCQKLGLEILAGGSGLAVEQSPGPGTHVPAGTRLWVRFAR